MPSVEPSHGFYARSVGGRWACEARRNANQYCEEAQHAVKPANTNARWRVIAVMLHVHVTVWHRLARAMLASARLAGLLK